jgi:hypothetical protein
MKRHKLKTIDADVVDRVCKITFSGSRFNTVYRHGIWEPAFPCIEQAEYFIIDNLAKVTRDTGQIGRIIQAWPGFDAERWAVSFMGSGSLAPC